MIRVVVQAQIHVRVVVRGNKENIRIGGWRDEIAAESLRIVITKPPGNCAAETLLMLAAGQGFRFPRSGDWPRRRTRA